MTVTFPLGLLYGFLLVLARVSGLVAFLPVPGFRNAPETVRIVLALSLTVALLPVWPDVATNPGIGQLTAWAFREAGFGLMAGLAVQFLMDGFQIAAQMIGLEAGYGYASTVDPTSQADSGILQIMLTLATGILFFTLGVDRALIRAVAASLERFPPGSPGAWTQASQGMEGILRLGNDMLVLALRTAVPVTAVLLMMDVSLALLGRMQQQLQLLSLAFPVKMLAAVAMLAALAPALPKLFASAAAHTIQVLCRGSGGC